jgi:bifunctional polynucleotide phosphatase/kinase
MDGTIIVTQSGKVFPVDYKDWKISCPEVTKTLRMLSNDGYKIVIFTNQGGIGSKKVNENSFKEKVENIINVIKIPIQVFVATQGDIYRKPAPGMWNTFVSDVSNFLFTN